MEERDGWIRKRKRKDESEQMQRRPVFSVDWLCPVSRLQLLLTWSAFCLPGLLVLNILCLCVASEVEVSPPDIDYIDIPSSWWDKDADKSLLIGVHKHGQKLLSFWSKLCDYL